MSPTAGAKGRKTEAGRQASPTREQGEWSGPGIDGLPASVKIRKAPTVGQITRRTFRRRSIIRRNPRGEEMRLVKSFDETCLQEFDGSKTRT
ncbi:MAG: hypothetical protein J4G05_03005 [Chlorobi bacterium]|nr:hypothetical protein [Chlorobiota bacterium]